MQSLEKRVRRQAWCWACLTVIMIVSCNLWVYAGNWELVITQNYLIAICLSGTATCGYMLDMLKFIREKKDGTGGT